MADEAAMVVLMSTFPDEETARSLAHTLVEERLVACVNIVPGMTSIYRWKGEVETSAEVLGIMKTSVPVERVMARIKELHSYEVPEIVVVPVSAVHPAYLAWVRAESEEGK